MRPNTFQLFFYLFLFIFVLFIEIFFNWLNRGRNIFTGNKQKYVINLLDVGVVNIYRKKEWAFCLGRPTFQSASGRFSKFKTDQVT